MNVAVDVDGVLADHVPAVLNRIRENHPDFAVTKRDIQTWDEELSHIDSDMKREIERAESDPEFVLEIPPVEGAIGAMKHLSRSRHNTFIVTHRPESILPATHKWLRVHGIPYNGEDIVSTNGTSKALVDADVLIDDFPGHIREFVENGGIAILFEQPWNDDFKSEFDNHPRAYVADDWQCVIEIIGTLTKDG